jgi:predicted  nucleic acid-binding Zn-ribbon protein
MNRKPHNELKIKAWTPTRRQLIEELGTASDRDLGLKYSLSRERIRMLRRENGIASYTKNQKSTPISDLQEKVQSLDDEVIHLHDKIGGVAARLDILEKKINKCLWKVHALGHSEDRLRQLIIDEVSRIKPEPRPVKKQEKTKGRRFADHVPAGFAYQEFYHNQEDT